MRIRGAVMLLSGLREVAVLRLGPRHAIPEGMFLGLRVSLEGPGRDKESVPRGGGPLEDSSACESNEE